MSAEEGTTLAATRFFEAPVKSKTTKQTLMEKQVAVKNIDKTQWTLTFRNYLMK